MSHMPSYGSDGSSCADSSCSGGGRLVRYTATGSEGTDFFVTITDSDGNPITLADDNYTPSFFSFESLTNVPVCAFPNSDAADRTTTQFRVVTAAVLTAGDVVVFEIVEN